MLPAARVMLPSVILFRKENNGFHASGAMLPSLLEQLIFVGATTVVIKDSWRYKDNLEQVPDIYKKYIQISDSANKANDLSLTLFSPAFAELGIEYRRGAFINHGEIDRTLFEATILCFSEVETFINACLVKAQAQVDLEFILRNLVTVILPQLRSQEARANLSCLVPIFKSYKVMSIDTIHAQSSSNMGLAERLDDILRSAEFKLIAEARFKLGAGRMLTAVRDELQNRVKRLLALAPAKAIFGYSSSVVAATTGIPMPEADLAESLLSQQFLPPIVDLTPFIDGARNQFFDNLDGDMRENYFSPKFDQNKKIDII